MFASWKTVLPILSLLALGSNYFTANAQEDLPPPSYEYLDQESLSVTWEATAAGVGAGNGIYIIPNNRMVVVSRDGTIRAYNRLSGQQIWGYAPDAMFESFSGAFYSGGGAVPYICYSIVSGGLSQVVALNPANGQPLAFSTGLIDGVAVGTPVTSADGQYIYTNYNTVDGTKGFFAVYDIDSPADPIYTYTNDIGEPFGALGYFHNPVRGYYTGGEDNTNDIFIWSLDNESSNSTVGTGQMYAFQMPLGANPMDVVLLGNDRGFQASLPPIITNEGVSMYWAVSKNEQRCWTGVANLNRFGFDKNSRESVGFPRGNPFSASALAPPSLSSSTSEPIVYGPTASEQIYRMTYQFEEGASEVGSARVPTINTTGIVSSRILVGKDDSVIYYATPAPDGKLYQLDAETLATIWSFDLGGVGIEGDIAQSDDGSYVYVADVAGKISAFLVANVVASPTVTPTTVPTGPPTGEPSTMPSDLASSAPSFFPTTDTPSISPTETASLDPTTSMEPTIDGTYPPTVSPKPSPVPTAEPTLTKAPVVAGATTPIGDVTPITEAPVTTNTGTSVTSAPAASPVESPILIFPTDRPVADTSAGSMASILTAVCALVFLALV